MSEPASTLQDQPLEPSTEQVAQPTAATAPSLEMPVPDMQAAQAPLADAGLAMPPEVGTYTAPEMQAPADFAVPQPDPLQSPMQPMPEPAMAIPAEAVGEMSMDAQFATQADPAMVSPMDPNLAPPLDPSQMAQPANIPGIDPAYAAAGAAAAATVTAQHYQQPEEDLTNVRPVPRVAIQAFCESEAVANTIDYASRDRRMAKAHVKVEMGGIRAAVEFYQTATTPNLIVVESALVGGELIGELSKLAEVCDEGTNVVVIGHKNDVALYRDLISRGVAEYLVAPIAMGELMEVISTLFVNPEAAPLGNTITFLGAKGGVGSSTIAHNVAWAISNNFESDVILTDLDLAFGTANIDFDQDPAQGVAEAVFSSDRIDETFLDRLLAKCSDHLSLLAAPSTLDREYDFDADDFTQLLEVAQRGTPNVVVDLPHVWTGWARQVLSASDKVVITATPDLACLRNTKNLIDTMAELRPNDDKPYLVLNQCNVPKRPEITVEDFTQPLEMDPTIILPFDPALFGLAANNGQMLGETDPKSEAAQSIEVLSQILTGRREIEAPKKGGLLSKFSLSKKQK